MQYRPLSTIVIPLEDVSTFVRITKHNLKQKQLNED